MKKRVLALLLAACMVFSASPVAAYADNVESGGEFAVEVAESELNVSEKEEADEEFVVSEEEAETEETVAASQEEIPAIEPVTIFVENPNPYAPYTGSEESEEECVGSGDEDIPKITVSDDDELCKQVRYFVIERVPKFQIVMKQVELPLEGDWGSTIGNYVQQGLKKKIDATLYEHTGVSYMGDYIKYQVGGVPYNGNYTNIVVSDGKITFDCTYDFGEITYYTTAEQEKKVTDRIAEVIESLNLSADSAYNKVKKIHDFIFENTEYDTEHLADKSYKIQYTAYGALINKTSVCQGYANLFYRMCLEAGVDARIISGKDADSNDDHAWNIVKLGNLYYDIDVTWDDPISNVPLTEPYYNWFLIDHRSFSQTHVRDDEYATDAFYAAYPMSEDDYTYTYLDDYSDDEPLFLRHSIALGSKIGVFFFMKLPVIEGVDYSTSYMEFTVRGKNGKTTTQAYNPDFRNSDGLLYGFSCDVTSIQMADTITAVFHYNKNGVDKTVEETYSVQDYINCYVQYYSGENADLKTLDLVKAINDYGYYAQQYFAKLKGLNFGSDENCDYFAMAKSFHGPYDQASRNEAISKIYDPSTYDTTGNIAKISYALNLESETSIYVYFKPQEGYTGSVRVYYGDSEGYELEAVKLKDGRYRAVISNLTATLLNTYYNIWAVTDSGKNSKRISATTYIKACLKSETTSEELKNLAMALYEYSEKSTVYSWSQPQAS